MPAAGEERWSCLRREALGDGIMDAAVAIAMMLGRPEEERSPFWLARWRTVIDRGLSAAEREVERSQAAAAQHAAEQQSAAALMAAENGVTDGDDNDDSKGKGDEGDNVQSRQKGERRRGAGDVRDLSLRV